MAQNSATKLDHGSFRAEDLTEDELAWIIKKSYEELANNDADKGKSNAS